MTGKLLVATRPGGPVREATAKEKCQHVWVRNEAWSSGGQHAHCINCPATTILKDES